VGGCHSCSTGCMREAGVAHVGGDLGRWPRGAGATWPSPLLHCTQPRVTTLAEVTRGVP
jgi:hypothetical protein